MDGRNDTLMRGWPLVSPSIESSSWKYAAHSSTMLAGNRVLTDEAARTASPIAKHGG